LGPPTRFTSASAPAITYAAKHPQRLLQPETQGRSEKLHYPKKEELLSICQTFREFHVMLLGAGITVHNYHKYLICRTQANSTHHPTTQLLATIYS
jgi:hypothetical protein